MLFLISNDDGILAKGIDVLERAVRVAHDVAPAVQRVDDGGVGARRRVRPARARRHSREREGGRHRAEGVGQRVGAAFAGKATANCKSKPRRPPTEREGD